MGTVAVRCYKCGKMKTTTKRNFMDGYYIYQNRPVCRECYNNVEKKK